MLLKLELSTNEYRSTVSVTTVHCSCSCTLVVRLRGIRHTVGSACLVRLTLCTVSVYGMGIRRRNGNGDDLYVEVQYSTTVTIVRTCTLPSLPRPCLCLYVPSLLPSPVPCFFSLPVPSYSKLTPRSDISISLIN